MTGGALREGANRLHNLERNDIDDLGSRDGFLRQEPEVVKHVEDVDVVVAEPHPEPDIRHAQKLGQGMHLVMSGQVSLLATYDRQFPFLSYFEHTVGLPVSVLPGSNLSRELAEIDLGIEVRSEDLP